MKTKRVLALVLLFKSKLLSKISKGETYLNSKSNRLIDVQIMKEAKIVIISMVQKRSSGTEIKIVTNNEKIDTLK